MLKPAKIFPKGKCYRWVLIVWIFISVFAPFLANEKAILQKDSNGWSMPLLNQKIEDRVKVTFQIKPPIPYHHTSIDYNNANGIGPFENQNVKSKYYRHWLGTDELGRDVLANLIYGSRTAFLVGVASMLIAALIGIFLGLIAGYYGDYKILGSRRKLWIMGLAIISLMFIGLPIIPWEIVSISLNTKLLSLFTFFIISVSCLYFLNRLINLYERNKALTLKAFPLDLFIGRLIEIMESLPLLFLIIAFSAILTPSITTIVILIGISSWSGIAKFARAEALVLKESNYVNHAKAIGMSNFRIIYTHILPNALSPILVSLAFGISAAILIESSLSFLGIGIQNSEASWGSLLASARQDYQSWWLAIFPGLAIFLTVYSCNKYADKLSS